MIIRPKLCGGVALGGVARIPMIFMSPGKPFVRKNIELLERIEMNEPIADLYFLVLTW